MPRLSGGARSRKTSKTPPATLPLDPGQTTPIATMVSLAEDRWSAAVLEGAMSAQTHDKFLLVAKRFDRFAHAHAITSVGEVGHHVVLKFLTAQGRSRHGNIAPSAAATMRNRRSAIRALYRTAREAGLIVDDPTTDIGLPPRDKSAQRPLTSDEAALVRLFSQRERPTRHAATAALLLAGVHTAELGHITTTNIDLNAGDVHAHGSSKHCPRVLTLDTWSVRVLADRIEFLNQLESRGAPSPVVCTGAEGSDAHKQARVCVTVREILTRAGLSDDPTIRPSSLTAFAGRLAYEQTGLIESAAIALGSASLDIAAALIGHRWR